MRPHDPRAVANFFMRKAEQHRKKLTKKHLFWVSHSSYYLTALQLNKMVFAAFGFHLAMHDARLCNEMPHNYGTAGGGIQFPSLHNSLMAYGLDKVKNYIYEGDAAHNRYGNHTGEVPLEDDFSTEELTVLEATWDCQIKTNMRCVDWSRYTALFDENEEIREDDIKQKFLNILKRADEARAA